MFTRLYGFETVAIRYFNVFGPRQDPGSPYSGVISLFATALLEGRQPTIYGDGEQTRDFTYVANVVDGVLRACEAPKVAGEVINVATGGRISLNELLRVMNRIVGARSWQPIYKEERAGDVKDSQADITKAQNAARLRAARRARGGPAAHPRVVPGRTDGTRAARGREIRERTLNVPIQVEVNLKIPRVTLRPADGPAQVIDNSAIRYTRLIDVPAVPKAGEVLQVAAGPFQTFDCSVTRSDWSDERELFIVSCSYAKRSMSGEEYDALVNDAEWKSKPLF